MLELLGTLVSAVIAHSECVALFTILLIQQWAMHIVNTRKIDSVPRKVEATRHEAARREEGDDAP